jgi:hypothetical protein
MIHADLNSPPLLRKWRENLSPEFCKHVINKFENDSRVQAGITMQGHNPNIKQSEDLAITGLVEWAQEDSRFFDALRQPIEDYLNDINSRFALEIVDGHDTGYQIQKTKPGGGYTWHHDFLTKNGNHRILTYIWYLNTITEGGYTEFASGQKIKPEQGMLILFPATWCFVHRGLPPAKGEKYICTGWLYSKS